MALYHFSEEPGITRFEPRTVPARPEVRPYVWAIDEWHAPMYFVPRDCPRACFWPGPGTSDEDRERFFGGVAAKMVVAIETAWFERVRTGRLYRYVMPEGGFRLNDATAGHWVSDDPVEPLGMDVLDDLPAALVAANVELRVTPSLIDLWTRIIASTMEFSGTRLRNAAGIERLRT